jgi:UDP-glucose 4-epimerase
MTSVLVTGGLGFIGSHTTVELLHEGYDVIILDDCSNANEQVLSIIEQITHKKPNFYKGSIHDRALLDQIFTKHKITAVLHFAAFKAVNESVNEPLKYYQNNVGGTLSLLDAMASHQVTKLVFSSSATVYDDSLQPPFVESMALGSSHAYGQSKVMIEEMLRLMSNQLDSIALRYFNPVGAHPSGLLGESPLDTPNNLMPLINQVAMGQRSFLNVFGSDYPTKDGTPERDYIHVVDVARAHVLALDKLKKHQGFIAVNIGMGYPLTVLDLLQTYERVNNLRLSYQLTNRRAGDLASSYANVDLAKAFLGFQTTYTKEDMCKHAYEFVRNR